MLNQLLWNQYALYITVYIENEPLPFLGKEFWLHILRHGVFLFDLLMLIVPICSIDKDD